MRRCLHLRWRRTSYVIPKGTNPPSQHLFPPRRWRSVILRGGCTKVCYFQGKVDRVRWAGRIKALRNVMEDGREKKRKIQMIWRYKPTDRMATVWANRCQWSGREPVHVDTVWRVPMCYRSWCWCLQRITEVKNDKRRQLLPCPDYDVRDTSVWIKRIKRKKKR